MFCVAPEPPFLALLLGNGEEDFDVVHWQIPFVTKQQKPAARR
jgi:hypothetical protein